MKKTKILQLVIEKLSADLALLLKAAKAAHEASIHEESAPDNKYDTLSLEASYVAQGQANRAQEIKAALESFKNLSLRDFDQDSPIRLTALVTLEGEDGTMKRVFIGPQAGGMKVETDGEEIVLITPSSPLGRGLIGKVSGDVVEAGAGEEKKEFEIVEVR